MNENIKLGITLYSYSYLYNFGLLDFEGTLKTSSELGYEGIEIVAAQMVPEYPYPSDYWIEQFKELLRAHHLKLITWSAYIDMGLHPNRDLTEEEIIQFTRNDMVYAKKAGAQLVRTQRDISPAIFKKMLPFCKALDLKLAIEMHTPDHPEVPAWKEYLEIMADPRSEGYLGVVPDFGVFEFTLPKTFKDRMLEGGFVAEKLDRILAHHRAGLPKEDLLGTGNFTKSEMADINEIYLMYSAPVKISDLKNLIPYAPYIHGKFHYVNEQCVDESIPYEKIMPEVTRLGYNGYIACEYEGHTPDCIEQLRRYKSMMTRLMN